MKNWYKFVVLLYCTLLVCSCRNRGTGAYADNSVAQQDSLAGSLRDEPVKDLNHHCDTTQWHEKRDTIVGKWDGNRIDTLIAEPIDTPDIPRDENDLYAGWHYNWRIRSLSGKIKPVLLPPTIAVMFVKEGDLDGDGTDEWGYKTIWPMGNWNDYYVLTYKHGQWLWLIEPVTTYADHFAVEMNVGTKTVEASKKKGWLDVKYSYFYDTICCVKDTMVRVKPIPIRRE